MKDPEHWEHSDMRQLWEKLEGIREGFSFCFEILAEGGNQMHDAITRLCDAIQENNKKLDRIEKILDIHEGLMDEYFEHTKKNQARMEKLLEEIWGFF